MDSSLCVLLILINSYGVYLNRAAETNTSHKIYSMEVGPSRNRLTHSMIFEQFEMVLENWEELNKEYA